MIIYRDTASQVAWLPQKEIKIIILRAGKILPVKLVLTYESWQMDRYDVGIPLEKEEHLSLEYMKYRYIFEKEVI